MALYKLSPSISAVSPSLLENLQPFSAFGTQANSSGGYTILANGATLSRHILGKHQASATRMLTTMLSPLARGVRSTIRPQALYSPPDSRKGETNRMLIPVSPSRSALLPIIPA